MLYIRIFDAYKASYGVEDAEYAISQLAQTTMRSEIGQLSLDHVLKERAALNVNITKAINEAAEDWGVKCLRYEIRDIHAPEPVLQASSPHPFLPPLSPPPPSLLSPSPPPPSPSALLGFLRQWC